MFSFFRSRTIEVGYQVRFRVPALGGIFNCCTALGKNLCVEPPMILNKEYICHSLEFLKLFRVKTLYFAFSSPQKKRKRLLQSNNTGVLYKSKSR